MCGICGVYNYKSTEVETEHNLKEMCGAMVHRGPDAEGYYVKGSIALGMRRLSINDLNGGNQPISNEDQSIWIVCNGEIYNHPSLRKTLEHLGHRYKCNSDVESIIHAYEEYGEDCFNLINGMFSFALWDQRYETLYISRDRTGIKPLFYTETNGQLIFSSELKSLLAHKDVKRDLDYLSLNQYLSYEYIPTPRSIIKNVKKLPPGHFLKINSKRSEIKPYWRLSFERSESRPPMALSDIKHQFLTTLDESINLELLSDVPVGVFLSGGLDSSSIAALAIKRSSNKLKTFSVAFEDPSFDESKYARSVAKHIGSDHHEQCITPQMIIDTAHRIDSIIDEPLGDSSIIPTYLVSKFASEHVKVALGGDGGDELLAGYQTMQAHKLVDYYERFIPHAIRANLIPRFVNNLPTSLNNISFDFKAKRFISGRGVPFGVRHHLWLGSFNQADKSKLFNSNIDYQMVDTYGIVDHHLNQCDAKNSFNRLLYMDMKMYLEGNILQKLDRASMANSLEVRVPILNHHFVNFITNVPFEFKMRGFKMKYLFKKAMKGLLPDEIINRKKKGFNIPVGKLFQNELKELLYDNLSESTINRQKIFNSKYINKILNEHQNNIVDHRKSLWTLLMFQLWHRKHLG